MFLAIHAPLSRNLKRIARDLGEKLTDDELRGMIDDAWREELAPPARFEDSDGS